MKTLTITFHHRHPKFLQLPRELRDVIYTYAFAEPTQYLKRHRPGCTHRDPDRSSETPLMLFHRDTPEALDRFEAEKEEEEHIATCKRLCTRRKGFGLLRVSRQVYREAWPILYAENTFAFASREDCVRTMDGFSGVQGFAEPSMLGRVQRLALWYLDPTYSSPGRGKQEIHTQLARLSNLRFLECLWSEIVGWEEGLCRLQKLEVFRMWMLEIMQYDDGGDSSNGWPRGAEAHVGFWKEWKIPACARERASAHGCTECEDVVRDIASTAQLWTVAQREDFVAPIRKKLERLRPTQQEDGPPKMKVVFTSGVKETVYVLGLPLEPAAVRRAREAKAKRTGKLSTGREV